jgi:radical SAM protein with 4Fe4S-binding SPASM domain
MPTFEPHPVVMWELTRACDLHCRGCPSGADSRREPNELTTYEAYKTVDQIAALQPRELIITGGDPLLREDVYQIVDYARRRGLTPTLVFSPTPELTFEAISRLEFDGLTRVCFNIDGSTAAIHESVHSVPGTYAATLRALRWAECAGLKVEINTLVTKSNEADLEAIVALLKQFAVARWNVHFVVPIGDSRELGLLTAEEVERVFARIDAIRAAGNFPVRVVEAPHYRRFHLERNLETALESMEAWADFTNYTAAEPETARELLDSALDGASGFVYISHAGDVRPSEFVPLSAGCLRYRSLADIYRGSDLFVALRDTANLKGKCARCDYRHLCGGSRARAWAMTGDLFGSDPLCAYEPSANPRPPLGHQSASA